MLGWVQAWGVLEYRAGCLEKARELFQQGVWADPSSTDVARVFQAWGVLEQQAGAMVLARELFRCAVKADPKSETSWQASQACCPMPV
jgi:Tfp pilus assembly protein PilF